MPSLPPSPRRATAAGTAPRIRRRHGRPSGALALAICALAMALFAPHYAAGHGIVLDSSPRDGETVAAPSKMVIRFNSRLEKRLCSVTLVGPGQQQILLVRQDESAPPDTLIFAVPDLQPGSYRAKWKVLAADGHVTEGAISFTVDPRAAAR